MEGNVTVSVTTESRFGGAPDTLHFSGSGQLERTDYGWHLRYHATNDADGSPVDSDIKIETASSRAVLINESGENGYGLLLDPKAMTATKIEAGGGALTLNVTTKEVTADLGGKEGTIILEYTLLVGMQPMSALRVSIRMKKER